MKIAHLPPPRHFVHLLIALVAFAHLAQAQDALPTTGHTNCMSEWTFVSAKNYTDPFNQVEFNMEVTAPDGTKQLVPGFWAGKQTWRVRYASPTPGVYRWKLACSDHANPDLEGATGSITLTPYVGDNTLYRHGPIKVSPDHRHFTYADGTPFFWLGDTWWMGLCNRMNFPEDFQTLGGDRKKKGFTVIQIVAGLYPDMFPFDPRGANEAGYPWEKDYARIRPEYFDAADRRLEFLVDEGLSPCLVGAWGYFVTWMSVDQLKQHWRYLIARYGALPVTWCAAGEANLPWYLAPGFPYDDRKAVVKWTEIMRYIRATDPYHRPLTIHPTGIGRLSARNATDDVNLLDFDMLQTPHAERGAVEPTVQTMVTSYADTPVMPVINGEAAYEMLGNMIHTEWTRQMFWLCMMNGAAGHTYGANGIWQVNRPGHPHGSSPNGPPNGTGYGTIPWQEAMNLPGSGQEAAGKRLFERYDWQSFVPHQDWAAYSSASPKTEWGQWIWFNEGEPNQDAPIGKRFFRKEVTIPAGATITNATLTLAADDSFSAYIDGHALGSHSDWQHPQSFPVTALLTPGRNLLAISAENLPAAAGPNPAGLIATLSITLANGQTLVEKSDSSWRCSKDSQADESWTTVAYDDHQWQTAKDIGAYGSGPWGRFQDSATYGPYTVGNTTMRMTYGPQLAPIIERQLQPQTPYQLTFFNPASALERQQVATSDASGTLAVAPPAQTDAQDWVLVVEPVKSAGH